VTLSAAAARGRESRGLEQSKADGSRARAATIPTCSTPDRKDRPSEHYHTFGELARSVSLDAGAALDAGPGRSLDQQGSHKGHFKCMRALARAISALSRRPADEPAESRHLFPDKETKCRPRDRYQSSLVLHSMCRAAKSFIVTFGDDVRWASFQFWLAIGQGPTSLVYMRLEIDGEVWFCSIVRLCMDMGVRPASQICCRFTEELLDAWRRQMDEHVVPQCLSSLHGATRSVALRRHAQRSSPVRLSRQSPAWPSQSQCGGVASSTRWSERRSYRPAPWPAVRPWRWCSERAFLAGHAI